MIRFRYCGTHIKDEKYMNEKDINDKIEELKK